MNNFKEKKFTTEEPNLKKISHKKIEILENEKEILKKKIIFFTYDTAINEKNGFPNLSIIENYIKKLLSFKFLLSMEIFSNLKFSTNDFLILSAS